MAMRFWTAVVFLTASGWMEVVECRECELAIAWMHPQSFVSHALGDGGACTKATPYANKNCCDKIRELFGKKGVAAYCLCNQDFFSAWMLGFPAPYGIQPDDYLDMLIECEVPVHGQSACGERRQASEEEIQPSILSQGPRFPLLSRVLRAGLGFLPNRLATPPPETVEYPQTLPTEAPASIQAPAGHLFAPFSSFPIRTNGKRVVPPPPNTIPPIESLPEPDQLDIASVPTPSPAPSPAVLHEPLSPGTVTFPPPSPIPTPGPVPSEPPPSPSSDLPDPPPEQPSDPPEGSNPPSNDEGGNDASSVDSGPGPPSNNGGESESSSEGGPDGCQSVMDVMRKSADLSNFVQIIDAAGLSLMLGAGFVGTVFAPTNAAWNDFVRQLGATFNSLIDPQSRDLVVQIIELHIVPGPVVEGKDLVEKKALKTALGSGETIAISPSGGSIAVAGPGNSKGVPIERQNMKACGAILHVIGGVLLPGL